MKTKKNIFIVLGLFFLFVPYSMAWEESVSSPIVEECSNAEYWEEFAGSIGPYKVVLHHDYGIGENGPWEGLMYKYTSVRVNKGDWIQCDYAGEQGQYTIWKEKINGKHTGTFKIIIDSETITGTFTNSKGQKYNVYAKLSEGWGINGAY